MSLTIDLPPDVEGRLKEAAAQQGQAPGEFIRAAVEQKLDAGEWRARMETLLTAAQSRAATRPGTREEMAAEVAAVCEEVRAEHYAHRQLQTQR